MFYCYDYANHDRVVWFDTLKERKEAMKKHCLAEIDSKTAVRYMRMMLGHGPEFYIDMDHMRERYNKRFEYVSIVKGW